MKAAFLLCLTLSTALCAQKEPVKVQGMIGMFNGKPQDESYLASARLNVPKKAHIKPHKPMVPHLPSCKRKVRPCLVCMKTKNSTLPVGTVVNRDFLQAQILHMMQSLEAMKGLPHKLPQMLKHKKRLHGLLKVHKTMKMKDGNVIEEDRVFEVGNGGLLKPISVEISSTPKNNKKPSFFAEPMMQIAKEMEKLNHKKRELHHGDVIFDPSNLFPSKKIPIHESKEKAHEEPKNERLSWKKRAQAPQKSCLKATYYAIMTSLKNQNFWIRLAFSASLSLALITVAYLIATSAKMLYCWITGKSMSEYEPLINQEEPTNSRKMEQILPL